MVPVSWNAHLGCGCPVPLNVTSIWAHHFLFSHTCPSILVPCFISNSWSGYNFLYLNAECQVQGGGKHIGLFCWAVFPSPSLLFTFPDIRLEISVTDRASDVGDWVTGRLIFEGSLKIIFKMLINILFGDTWGNLHMDWIFEVVKIHSHGKVAITNRSDSYAEMLAAISDLWEYG